MPRHAVAVKLSIWPALRQPWNDVVEVARHADATGWDGFWLADHFMGDGEAMAVPTLEVTAALPALAGETSRIRLGTLVLGNTYRHPAVVANWAVTVDHLSGGRMVLGLGAGWQENEHHQYGIPLPSPGERLRRLDEACVVVRTLLRDPIARFDGAHYALRDAVCEPKPLGPLPLLLGVRQDRALRLVARHADEWNMWAVPEMLRERDLVLRRHCDELGRDRSAIRTSVQVMVRLTDDEADAAAFREQHGRRRSFAGDAGAFADFVAECGEAGADEFIVPDQGLETGQRRLEAMDALRAAVT